MKTKTVSVGEVVIGIQVDGMQEILKKLYSLEHKEAKKILKDAARDTVEEAKKIVAAYANATYVRKRVKDFDKSMKIKNPTLSRPIATITSKGPISEPLDYHASPLTLAQQRGRKSAAKVQVVRENPSIPLEYKGNKAFLAKFDFNTITGKMNKKSHYGIVARTGKKPPDTPILHTFYSNSIPVAIGSERTMKLAEPAIRKKLQDNLEKHIAEVLSKK